MPKLTNDVKIVHQVLGITLDGAPFSPADDPIGLVDQFTNMIRKTLSSVKKLYRRRLAERGVCTLPESVHEAIDSVLLALEKLRDTTSEAKSMTKMSKNMAKGTLKSVVGILKGLLNALPELDDIPGGSGKGSHATTKTVTKDVTRTHQETQTIQVEIERKWTTTNTATKQVNLEVIVSKDVIKPHTTRIPATTTTTSTTVETITSYQAVQHIDTDDPRRRLLRRPLRRIYP
jgi:hypothetical protein